MKALAAVSAAVLMLAVGCAGSASSDESSSSNLTSQPPPTTIPAAPPTDAMIKTELEGIVQGLTYTSEADYPWTYVWSADDPDQPSGYSLTLSVDQVRKLFGAYVDNDPDTDKPIAKLYSETRTFEEWSTDDLNASCDANNNNNANEVANCAGTKKLDLALKTDLGHPQVFLFGADGSDGFVEGTAVSIFIIGRTAEGNWAGVRTIAIWT